MQERGGRSRTPQAMPCAPHGARGAGSATVAAGCPGGSTASVAKQARAPRLAGALLNMASASQHEAPGRRTTRRTRTGSPPPNARRRRARPTRSAPLRCGSRVPTRGAHSPIHGALLEAGSLACHDGPDRPPGGVAPPRRETDHFRRDLDTFVPPALPAPAPRMADPKPRPSLRIDTLATALEQKLDERGRCSSTSWSRRSPAGRPATRSGRQLHAGRAARRSARGAGVRVRAAHRDKKLKSLTARRRRRVLGARGVFLRRRLR